jgi:hypothetical protein
VGHENEKFFIEFVKMATRLFPASCTCRQRLGVYRFGIQINLPKKTVQFAYLPKLPAVDHENENFFIEFVKMATRLFPTTFT